VSIGDSAIRNVGEIFSSANIGLRFFVKNFSICLGYYDFVERREEQQFIQNHSGNHILAQSC
jgi:hypothetical protein